MTRSPGIMKPCNVAYTGAGTSEQPDIGERDSPETEENAREQNPKIRETSSP